MKILSCENIRSSERRTGERGTDMAVLMERAGIAAAQRLSEITAVCGKCVVVICGRGNNGGDGLIVAKQLALKGADVLLYLPFGVPASHPAFNYADIAKELKCVQELPLECDILVDALLGIGLDREITGECADIIGSMNACSALKVAIDLPSGVFCDGGASKTAFKADYTLTFIASKPCFFVPQSARLCGRVSVLDIGTDTDEYSFRTIEKPTVSARDPYSHKGDYGTALIIAGSYGMCGAQILACEAALRSGAGIVKTVVCDKNYAAFCASVPEAVTVPVLTSPSGGMIVDQAALESALSGADSLLIGPGLSRGIEVAPLLRRVLKYASAPIVIDADGINALCADISILRDTKAPVIITPHSGEMARLFNTTPEVIERDRVSFARDFAIPHRCIVVLKGHNTVVALPDGRVFFNTTGNAGMATGGSGDVLAGMMAGMIAAGKDLTEAVLSSVYYHGLAGDRALSRCCEAALIPSDIIEELKQVFAE